jgi:hypothetical protein
MNLRTIQFWAIYNIAQKSIIASAKTKKQLRERWGDMKDTPWCVFVRMKGHYVRRAERSSKT